MRSDARGLARSVAVFAALFVLVFVGVLLLAGAAPCTSAFADESTSTMSSMSYSTQELADSADADADADVAEELDQLGLVLRLWRLTGESEPASDESEVMRESVGALFPNLLAVTTTPNSISVGLECSNTEMCLIDPCTCGKPDAWGHCACGGFLDLAPTVTIDIEDTDVVCAVELFGQVWLVPVSAGTTHVIVTADLIHYESAYYAFDVVVEPFGLVDVVLIVALIVMLALIVLLAVLLVRLIVRVVRFSNARRRHWKQRAIELRAAHPLTWRAHLGSEKRAADGATSRLALAHSYAAVPFLHDLAFAFRQATPVLVVGLLVFVALVPLSTTMVEDVSVFNIDYTHEQLKYQLYAQGLSDVVNIACVCFGAALAVALFRFLLAKRETTAFLSLGLSRTALFLARYLAGAACVVVAIGIPFALSCALNGVALGFYDGFVSECLYVTCGYVVVALVSFTLASIATMRAGTLFEACAFAVVLLGGVTAILWGVGVLADYLLVGNAAGATLYGQDTLVEPDLLSQFSWLNPALFFADEGASHQYFQILHPVYYPETGSWLLVAAWFAVQILLAIGGALALRFRRGEQAEMAGKSPAFSFVAVAVFGCAAFAAAVTVLGAVEVRVALVVGAVAFAMLSAALLFGPLRGRTTPRMTLSCIGGEIAVMGIVVALIASGGLGFSSFIPEADEIESVEVSYVGSPSYLTMGISGVSSGSSYYFTSYRTYTAESSVEIVRSLHEQLVASARMSFETDYEDFESTVVPYDVVIRYQLANGDSVVRYFDRASIGELSALMSLDNDEHARELERAVVTGDVSALSDEEQEGIASSSAASAYRSGRIYAADAVLNRIVEISCSDEDRAALLEAIADDLESLSASERYSPSEATRVSLMFTLSPELDVSSFGFSFNNAVLYITSAWENTLAWLDERGFLEVLEGDFTAQIVESLTFQLDDPYASINKVTSPTSRYFMAYRSDTANQFWITQDYGALKEINDQDRIAEILPNLRTGCAMTGGYLVQAKLRGIEAYVYLYLPAELAPDDL